MALPPLLQGLRIPAFGAPLFIIQNPDLVIAQCKAGIPGCFPALNAREEKGEPPLLDAWLTQMGEELDGHNQANPDRPAAPFGVNQIVHRSNKRLERDLEIMVRHEVQICVTALGARPEVYEAVRGYGGITFHDVINDRFARKAVEKGADGLIAVACGAGGHAGPISSFALVEEIREWFDGPLLLAGAIAGGHQILAAEAMGADLGYIRSAFFGTEHADAEADYKQRLIEGSSADIVSSSWFTGIPASYLAPSMRRAGLVPEALPAGDASMMEFSEAPSSDRPKAWSEILSSGQGINAVKQVVSAAELIARLEAEYHAARHRLALDR